MMQLEPGVTILDEKKFVHAHMSYIDNNQQEERKRFISPYQRRIDLFMRLKGIIDLDELRNIYQIKRPKK